MVFDVMHASVMWMMLSSPSSLDLILTELCGSSTSAPPGSNLTMPVGCLTTGIRWNNNVVLTPDIT